MQTADLLPVLDTFLEAARRVAKLRALASSRRKLEKALPKAWNIQGRAFLKGFAGLQADWRIAESGWIIVLREQTPADLDGFFDQSEAASYDLFLEPLSAAAQAGLLAGSHALIADLGLEVAFDLKNPRAVTYLKAHGADLVKQINETTRDDLRHVIEYAADNGWSYSRTALAIQKRYKGYYEPSSWWNFDAPRPQGHIESRAHLIAVTESGEAYEAGNYAVIQDLADSGLEMEKSWSTMRDSKVSQGCRDNAAEGWIPYDQEFSSGHQHPLRFPGCRCDLSTRIKP